MYEPVTAKSGLPYVRVTMYVMQGNVTAAYLAILRGKKKSLTRTFRLRTIPQKTNLCT
jgi:hypothetical protein